MPMTATPPASVRLLNGRHVNYSDLTMKQKTPVASGSGIRLPTPLPPAPAMETPTVPVPMSKRRLIDYSDLKLKQETPVASGSGTRLLAPPPAPVEEGR